MQILTLTCIQKPCAYWWWCRALVRLQFEGSDKQQDAAFAALAALGTYNRGSKLSQLHELVRRLIDGQSKVCALL